MTRTVVHEARKDGKSCSCGARLKTPRDLRRHLEKANGRPSR